MRTTILATSIAVLMPLAAASCGERAASTGTEPVKLSEPVPMHFAVKGMHCDGCEGAICGKVEKIEGVTSVQASHAAESVDVVAPPEQRKAIEA
ncbi:MAG: heavy-metal-associated domain-containing protein, partial [Phycisphaerales bacterium]